LVYGTEGEWKHSPFVLLLLKCHVRGEINYFGASEKLRELCLIGGALFIDTSPSYKKMILLTVHMAEHLIRGKKEDKIWLKYP